MAWPATFNRNDCSDILSAHRFTRQENEPVTCQLVKSLKFFNYKNHQKNTHEKTVHRYAQQRCIA